MELNKKKRISGFITVGIFTLWTVIDVIRVVRLYMEYLEYVTESAPEPVFGFVQFAGIQSIAVWAMVFLLGILVMVLTVGGFGKKRLNFMVPVAVSLVLGAKICDLVRDFEYMGYILENIVELSFSDLIELIGYISEWLPVLVLILVTVMSVIGAVGNSFMKKVWFIPSILYTAFTILSCVTFMMMFIVLEIEIDAMFFFYDTLQIFFAAGLGVFCYWISLHMPESEPKSPRPTVAKVACPVQAKSNYRPANKQRPQALAIQPADFDEKIRKYKQLLDEGLLTEDEFERKRRELLGL